MAVKLLDFLAGLSGALDLVSPEVVGHHKRVAYLAVRLGQRLELSREELTDLFMAGLLHDVGGFTLQSRLDALRFETDGARHAEIGYRLLRQNPVLQGVALLVRHHHTPSSRFDALDVEPRMLFLANILNLVDRVDVLRVRYHLSEPEDILSRLSKRSGSQFLPELLGALGDLVREPTLWRRLSSPDPTAEFGAEAGLFLDRGLSRGQLARASSAFSQVIDFRSRFTSTHSCGVAETACQLGRLSGFSEADTETLRLAGDLHDLGKLAVPAEILDKPGPLDLGERAVMRRHPELTAAILEAVPGLETISAWASQHHEHLSGRGYPWSMSADTLSLGSRILAVADVFTALREDRPYRAGINSADSVRILRRLAADSHLDRDVVELVAGNQRAINARRREVQQRANAEFREFYAGLPQ